METGIVRIAVIGSGISGLSCAHYLSTSHEVSVFEAGRQVGGHTATVDVKLGTRRYAIDTGRWSQAQADEFMLSVWQPDEHPPWPRWLEQVKSAYFP